MKRLLMLLLTAVLVLSILPVSVFALEENDQNFDLFLTEIGWEKQDYLDYLESKDYSLNEFSIEDLGTPLTEETIQSVLVELDLTREELNKLLSGNGDLEKNQDVLDGNSLIFTEEVIEYAKFYMNSTPIDSENLQELVEYYEFGSVEELEEFLNSYGDSIENYEYIEDLDEEVFTYLTQEEIDFELDGLFSEFGLTGEELDRLGEHLETLDFEDPAFEAKLTELGNRMMAIGEFETAEELTAGQIAEILSIFTELQSMFQVNTQYYLISGNEKQAISMDTLLTLDTTNGFDILIEIYNQQGTFLADVLLTAEMFGSEIIVDTGDDVKEIEDVISEAPAKAPVQAPAKPQLQQETKKPVVSSTVKGGKLPKTAGNYVANALAGLAIALIGFVLFRRFKVAGI